METPQTATPPQSTPPPCSALTEEECDRLHAFLVEGAAKVKVTDAYHIDGDDCGTDYCLQCAEKELVRKVALYRRLPKDQKRRLERPSLGGGYRIEHDSFPNCDKCGALLDGSLTNYGCESELEHFLKYGFEIEGEYADHNRYSLDEVVTSLGWHCHEYAHESDWKRSQKRELYIKLHTLGRRILDALNAEVNSNE